MAQVSSFLLKIHLFLVVQHLRQVLLKLQEAVARGMKAFNKALAKVEEQAKLAVEHREKQ